MLCHFVTELNQNAFKVVRPEKGIKKHDTLTRLECKEDIQDNGVVIKCEIRPCARGDQQVKCESFVSSDLLEYAPTLKVPA